MSLAVRLLDLWVIVRDRSGEPDKPKRLYSQFIRDSTFLSLKLTASRKSQQICEAIVGCIEVKIC